MICFILFCIGSVENILDSAGYYEIWRNQSLLEHVESADHLKKITKLSSHDQFIQNWNEGITHGGKCTVYRIIKNGFETYLIKIPLNNSILMTKCRCRNHRLPCLPVEADLRLCLH